MYQNSEKSGFLNSHPTQDEPEGVDNVIAARSGAIWRTGSDYIESGGIQVKICSEANDKNGAIFATTLEFCSNLDFMSKSRGGDNLLNN